MRLLCVANWSEGRNEAVLFAMRSALRSRSAIVHFDGADEDHNRIVTAFSGDGPTVKSTLFEIASAAFSGIDMRTHEGVHPRIGVLDVCPFILLEGNKDDALDFARGVGAELAEKYDLPVFLYEHSETDKHAADLPSLRKGQYEGLHGRELSADFGPKAANQKLGATVVGVRSWLIAMNVNLLGDKLSEARSIAREMRIARDDGNAFFSGTRALGLPLARRRLTQVSMNLTQPDQTSPDGIIDWIGERETIVSTELIGVIRSTDLTRARRLAIQPDQVITV